jgi:predicted ATP-grasp superfamily ATP-dependent carboligase
MSTIGTQTPFLQRPGKAGDSYRLRRVICPSIRLHDAPARGAAASRAHLLKDNRAGRGDDMAMADPSHRAKPLRVLLSEGNSTSARQALTILGLAGHHAEVCDPSPVCLCRFSRFVRKFHRCPGLRDDPAGYLAFMERLLRKRSFDVLLPIHEQGFLFARVRQRIEARVAVALPDFENYRIAQGKAGFSRLLDELGLPQPATRIVTSARQLREAVDFPCVIKTSIGTASRGVWFVQDADGLGRALQDLDAIGAFPGEVLVQHMIEGRTEKAQAVFSHGELIGFHACKEITAGVGGGQAIKQSVRRPAVRAHLATIGKRLAWHGALSVDFISTAQGAHFFVDCNPRLVEPMSAFSAGLDLVDLLLQVSRGQMPAPVADSREGVRTHVALQALLGRASRGGSRRQIAREGLRVLTGRRPYSDSVEELTPVRDDWISAIPLAMTALALLANPAVAGTLAKKGWGAHLLDARAVRIIEEGKFPAADQSG